jgi:hypothetical protein
MEKGFYGSGVSHVDNYDFLPEDNNGSVLGKLFTFCLGFYNSLTVWERVLLNSSEWLKKLTTNIIPQPSLVKETLGGLGVSTGCPESSTLHSLGGSGLDRVRSYDRHTFTIEKTPNESPSLELPPLSSENYLTS